MSMVETISVVHLVLLFFIFYEFAKMAKFYAKISLELCEILEKVSKKTDGRITQDLYQNPRDDESKSVEEKSTDERMGDGNIEKDWSNILSKKTKTVVRFGEDVE